MSVCFAAVVLLLEPATVRMEVLRCQRQPWLTFTASQSELNRLFSVLTTLTELALPPQLAHEINGLLPSFFASFLPYFFCSIASRSYTYFFVGHSLDDLFT